MRETNSGIRKKLLPLVILPIILLSGLITVIGVTLFYNFYTQSIRSELVSTTDTLLDCLDFAISGDYHYEDGLLFKGNLNITDSTMLLRIKEKSEIDTTFFWNDLRIMTTIEDENGVSAVGTKADSHIADVVLKEGEIFSSKNLTINNKKYIGYYAPVQNSGGDIVGMIFAGKQKDLVYHRITEVILWFVFFSVITVMIAVFITLKYATAMIADIDSINHFLKEISGGNLRPILEQRILDRDDEIGSIGVYAIKMRDNLRKLIERDSLTGLYNRRSCHNLIRTMVQKKETHCMVMCDIDYFKQVNDTYGHAAGDYVLCEISELIRENVRGCGFASRWGGEEFLLVYKMGFEETVEKAKQLQQSVLKHTFVYEGITMRITMTFGVADGTEDTRYEKVIQKADQQLYVGKNNGRNQVVA